MQVLCMILLEIRIPNYVPFAVILQDQFVLAVGNVRSVQKILTWIVVAILVKLFISWIESNFVKSLGFWVTSQHSSKRISVSKCYL
jgi:hypothetical protein